MTVAPNRECLERNHLSRPPLTFLIIIKTQCALNSVGTLHNSLWFISHTAGVSHYQCHHGHWCCPGLGFLSGHACLLTAGGQQAVENEAVILSRLPTLTDWAWDSHNWHGSHALALLMPSLAVTFHLCILWCIFFKIFFFQHALRQAEAHSSIFPRTVRECTDHHLSETQSVQWRITERRFLVEQSTLK